LTATESGNLLTSDIAPNYKDAADAVEGYFGTTISEGDKITITGDIMKREVRYTYIHLANVTDTSYVFTEKVTSDYMIFDINTKIKLDKTEMIGGKTNCVSKFIHSYSLVALRRLNMITDSENNDSILHTLDQGSVRNTAMADLRTFKEQHRSNSL